MKVEDGLTPAQRAERERLEERGRELAWLLDRTLNPLMTGPRDVAHRTTGFALLIFPFGDSRETSYISNADRGDMIKVIEQWLAHAKGRS